MWRELWRLLDDIGPGISILKCKGHATEADVQAGRCTAFERTGNGHADHYAGSGVDVAEHQRPNEELVQGYKEAKRWYTWLATLAHELPADTQPVPREPRPATATKVVAPWKRHVDWPHELVQDSLRLTCSMCQLHVSNTASSDCRRAFWSSRCPGAISSRAVENNTSGAGMKHVFFLSGAVTWCFTCGRYSEKRTTALCKQACHGAPEGYGGRAVSLRRLKDGQHPKDPQTRLPRARLLQRG